MSRSNASWFCCAVCLIAVVDTSAAAQTNTAGPPTSPSAASPFAPHGAVETVVVTARRRAENEQKIPVAVTAISGEELRLTQTKSAMDLQTLAPSLSVAANLGSRDTDVFTIRGQTQPFGGADPGVQSYFAEVPFNPSGEGSYFDMDSVQVLNGPQGTLFGRSTTGGAILFQPVRRKSSAKRWAARSRREARSRLSARPNSATSPMAAPRMPSMAARPSTFRLSCRA